MSVEVNSVRKAVEISWETGNPPISEPPPNEKPPGFPTHPIFFPIGPDHTLPGDQPRPDQGLPGDQPRPDQSLPENQPYPDQGLPGAQPRPEHPIYLPPYLDNSLPGDQPRPDQGLPELPPSLIEGIPPEKLEEIKEFLVGNLPSYGGGPDYASPVKAGSKHGVVTAVQVFAEGQEGDWSNTAVMPNDGLAVLTYPEDFEGTSYVEVRDLYGNLIDCGTIEVEAGE